MSGQNILQPFNSLSFGGEGMTDLALMQVCDSPSWVAIRFLL